jgi:AraC-like DNA-binding protein
MGVSFGRFDLRRRLVEASRLLLSSGESVQSIAERCGFTDRSHLLRMFRRQYGKTPTEFRSAGASGREAP